MRSLKLLEPYTFFVDRCLGDRSIPDALRAHGFEIRVHSDHFADNAPDVEWLKQAGQDGWVVLTKDKATLRNDLERTAVRSAKLALFALGSSGLRADQMAQAFIKAHRSMVRALRRFGAPLIAKISADGAVTVHESASGPHRPPKVLK